MDTLDILKVCVRRWYVMLPVVMMALGTGFALAKAQEPSYHARATFAFVYKNTSADPDASSPLLTNPLANTDLLGTALGLTLSAPAMQEKLGDASASGVAAGEPSNDSRFSLTGVTGAAGTYAVDAWGPSPSSVQTTVQNVMEAIPREVKRIQEAAGAPDGSLYTVFVMARTRVEEIPASSGLKLLIAVGGAGIVTGAALSIALDAVLAKRRPPGRPRRGKPEPPVEAEDAPDPVGSRAVPIASRDRRGTHLSQVGGQDRGQDAPVPFEALYR